MRGDVSRFQSATPGEEGDEGEVTGIWNRDSGHDWDITELPNVHSESLAPTANVSVSNQQQWDKHTCNSWQSKNFLCSMPRPLPAVDCSVVSCASKHQGQSSLPQTELRLSPSAALQPRPDESRLTPPADSFNSSFSFIQLSLTSSQRTDTTADTPTQGREPLNQSMQKHSIKAPNSPQAKPAASSLEQLVPELLSTPASQSEREELSLGGRIWRECLWGGREVTSELADCDSRSLDTEVTSSLSVDSDTASASSVTSGYESATPASEQGWDNLLKKYEGVLQDCLQNNRTNTKVGGLKPGIRNRCRASVKNTLDYLKSIQFKTKGKLCMSLQMERLEGR